MTHLQPFYIFSMNHFHRLVTSEVMVNNGHQQHRLLLSCPQHGRRLHLLAPPTSLNGGWSATGPVISNLGQTRIIYT